MVTPDSGVFQRRSCCPWHDRKDCLTVRACSGTVEIVRTAGVSKTAVWRWQERFMQEGVERSTFGNPLDELNCGERAASFPFVGKHEPCRIRAESIEGLFVWEIQQVRLGLTVERTNAQLQTPAMFREQR
jgi:hypothetical protein